MPFECLDLLGEPSQFAALRAQGGLTRHRTAAGDEGWLATNYHTIKTLCADDLVGRAHPDPPSASRLWKSALFCPLRNFATEVEDHRRWRQLVSSSLARQQILAMWPRLQATFDTTLDKAVRKGPPLDVVADLARPFAAASICAVLGVPRSDMDKLMRLSDRIRDQRDAAMADKAFASLVSYFEKQPPEPDGLLSAVAHSRLSHAQKVEAATFVFLGGFETVVARIAHGLLFLLAHPSALRRLRDNAGDDAGLVASAVEEMLRLAVPGGSWVPRYVRADTEFGGARLRAGDLVVFAFQSANRDERVFAVPDVFDIARTPNPHLAFGFGKFFCVGAGLARAEMQIAIATTVARLPGLRLAVDPRELEIERTKAAAGLRRLPVTWST
jgi:pentalenolactone synthase